MNFGFTPEQEQLREQVRRFLDARCPLPEVRKQSATAAGFSRALWQQMGELGWLGLIVPESFGGVGLSWVDVIVVLERGQIVEMGKHAQLLERGGVYQKLHALQFQS